MILTVVICLVVASAFFNLGFVFAAVLAANRDDR